jgi:hypothetical protein
VGAAELVEGAGGAAGALRVTCGDGKSEGFEHQHGGDVGRSPVRRTPPRAQHGHLPGRWRQGVGEQDDRCGNGSGTAQKDAGASGLGAVGEQDQNVPGPQAEGVVSHGPAFATENATVDPDPMEESGAVVRNRRRRTRAGEEHPLGCSEAVGSAVEGLDQCRSVQRGGGIGSVGDRADERVGIDGPIQGTVESLPDVRRDGGGQPLLEIRQPAMAEPLRRPHDRGVAGGGQPPDLAGREVARRGAVLGQEEGHPSLGRGEAREVRFELVEYRDVANTTDCYG